MAVIRLPYTVCDHDRHGNARHYVRIKGSPKVRLLGPPGSPEFMKAYHAATASARNCAEAGAGSFRAACIGYYASPDFKQLDPST